MKEIKKPETFETHKLKAQTQEELKNLYRALSVEPIFNNEQLKFITDMMIGNTDHIMNLDVNDFMLYEDFNG